MTAFRSDWSLVRRQFINNQNFFRQQKRIHLESDIQISQNKNLDAVNHDSQLSLKLSSIFNC